MEKVHEFLPFIIWGIVLVIFWFVIRRILKSISDKINNSELYKEDMLSVLEGIRDELKELNKNNSVK
jgi:flagellar biosynthesis/type III secretory pathway M-ring protein FliF/YscJ